MTTIGILGAGQLGRMLALAGYPLGLQFRFLDPAADSPAGQLAEHIAADYHDESALARFLDGVDVVTYEFENVPVDVAERIAESVPVYPPPVALEKAQDRLVEKSFFRMVGIPTPEFFPVGELSQLSVGLSKVGNFPAVLKTRRMGYDGKGQFLLEDSSSISEAWQYLMGKSKILEQFIPFKREVSLIVVRGITGEVRFYPLVENTHYEGILRRSVVRLEAHPLQAQVEAYARSVMDTMVYVGVLAIEFFEKDGRLLANEMAPRVHNSGHWSIEGAVTSQFENQVRAVSGLPLGSTDPLGVCGMVNLIGSTPAASDILKIEGAHLHLYGKSPRPGRKLGHVTFVEKDEEILNMKFEQMEKLLAND